MISTQILKAFQALPILARLDVLNIRSSTQTNAEKRKI
ncbi:hypothetical protein AC062_1481 [Pasteurellaceae bacterium NI1060]|nr:hypothetical protein AC062_1481 [Pasteurellaceae bacterium NI1060]